MAADTHGDIVTYLILPELTFFCFCCPMHSIVCLPLKLNSGACASDALAYEVRPGSSRSL